MSAPLWPLATLDIEASSLDHGSYPIEVGFALQQEPGGLVRGWSALVRPHWTWLEQGHWSARAARIHGISRECLDRDGRSPSEVAAALNATLGGLTVYCDGLPYDAYWLDRLAAAAGCELQLRLGAWTEIVPFAEPQERVLTALKDDCAVHRAREDAERLLRALFPAVSAGS